MEESPPIEDGRTNWEQVLWNERAPPVLHTPPLEAGPEDPSDRLTDRISRNAPLFLSPRFRDCRVTAFSPLGKVLGPSRSCPACTPANPRSPRPDPGLAPAPPRRNPTPPALPASPTSALGVLNPTPSPAWNISAEPEKGRGPPTCRRPHSTAPVLNLAPATTCVEINLQS